MAETSPTIRPQEDAIETRSRKRARRNSSCLKCRARKLRCDGVRPTCQRCRKQDAKCEYELPAVTVRTATGDGGDALAAATMRIKVGDRRYEPTVATTRTGLEVRRVEPSVAPAHKWGLTTEPSQDIKQSEVSFSNVVSTERMQVFNPAACHIDSGIRGVGWETQYWGFTHPTSLISEVSW